MTPSVSTTTPSAFATSDTFVVMVPQPAGGTKASGGRSGVVSGMAARSGLPVSGTTGGPSEGAGPSGSAASTGGSLSLAGSWSDAVSSRTGASTVVETSRPPPPPPSVTIRGRYAGL